MVKTSKVFQVVSLFILLLAVGLLMYSTWCGLGLTYDSHDYLAAAKSFRDSGMLINKNGQAFIAHSPLFPILISGLGQNPLTILRIVNLLFFAVTMIVIREIIQKNIRNEFLRLCVYFVIVFAVGIHMIYNFVWSEPLFLFLFVFHNWFLIRYLNRKKSVDMWILILLAFFIGITRNAGFFIIFPTAIFLLLVKNVRKSVSIFYFILGSLGFSAWNFYTFFLKDGISTFGKGLSLFRAIGLNVQNYLDILSTWAIPAFIPLIIRIILMLGLFSFMVVKCRIRKLSEESKFYFFQSVVYILIMIFFISVYKSDVERYLSVIYPWIFIGVFIVLDSWILNFNMLFKRLLIILVCCWFTYMSARTIKNSVMWHKNNCSYMIIHKLNNLSD